MKLAKIFAVFIILILIGCNKPGEHNLSGELEIAGSLYYEDTLRGFSEEVILNNHTVQVKLTRDTGSRNYLYEVKTNMQGAFTITNLSPIDYYLYAEFEKDDVLFSRLLHINPASANMPVKMVLYPDARQYNILTITTRDLPTNGLLSNAEICLFSSRFLAENNQCQGSVLTRLTDSFGQVMIKRLLPGRYYINARDSVGNVDINASDSVDVSQFGIVRKTVYLN